MKNIIRLTASFSTKNKIPRPRDPTMPESFETKLSDKEMKILLDPRGFMTEEEKAREVESQNVIKTEAKETGVKEAQEKVESQALAKGLNGVIPEYGFKPKGPQPTRYGDWQVKGKCVDF